MENNDLRGCIRTNPEMCSPEILRALTRGQARAVCDVNEHSGGEVWDQVRSYCASGHPELVAVRLTFEQGGLACEKLAAFLGNCQKAGCRNLQIAFNQRLAADDLLLENKDYLETNACLYGLQLSVDRESLDAVIFNRKASRQRAQTDWAPGSVVLAATGRWGARCRPGRDYGYASSAIGQN